MKQLIMITFVLTLCALLISPIYTTQADYFKTEYTKQNIKYLIEYYADKHNVSANVMSKVVNCESGYNPNAVNWQDSHKLSKGSHGVAQFSKETFKSYAKQMGKDYTDPYNPKEALDVMGYMFSKKQQNQWSCYKKVV